MDSLTYVEYIAEILQNTRTLCLFSESLRAIDNDIPNRNGRIYPGSSTSNEFLGPIGISGTSGSVGVSGVSGVSGTSGSIGNSSTSSIIDDNSSSSGTIFDNDNNKLPLMLEDFKILWLSHKH